MWTTGATASRDASICENVTANDYRVPGPTPSTVQILTHRVLTTAQWEETLSIFIFKDKDGTERLNNLPQVTGLVRNEKDVFWSLFSEAVLLTPILHAPQHGVYGPTLAADCWFSVEPRTVPSTQGMVNKYTWTGWTDNPFTGRTIFLFIFLERCPALKHSAVNWTSLDKTPGLLIVTAVLSPWGHRWGKPHSLPARPVHNRRFTQTRTLIKITGH